MPQHRDMIANAMQLHEEFPVEAAFLVEFMQATISAIKNNFTYNKERWDRQKKLYDFGVWADAIDGIDDRIKSAKVTIKKDAFTFARLLFSDGYRIFPLHCLFALADAIPENEKFNNKVIELFA